MARTKRSKRKSAPQVEMVKISVRLLREHVEIVATLSRMTGYDTQTVASVLVSIAVMKEMATWDATKLARIAKAKGFPK